VEIQKLLPQFNNGLNVRESCLSDCQCECHDIFLC
jgi:hypothetical protein